jgi:predicted MFS family arabinose efflux permease
MGKRWIMLGVLFAARTAMGFQYQSVASVSPLVMADLGIDYALFGVLLGLYLLPGIALALPGGFLGRRFGDKRVVVLGLGLMTAGGLVMGASHSYPVACAGRLLSGTGAILFNVLATKMVADWFAGKEIVTAMAIFVTSWPLGIGLALVSLAPIATASIAAASSWQAAMFLTALASLAALLLVAVVYRAPPETGDERDTAPSSFKFSRQELCLVPLAGTIWALFNVSFAILPGFAPDFLISSGYALVRAGALVSVVTWLLIFSVPLGGALAERLGHPNLVLLVCSLAIGLALYLLPYWPQPLLLLVVLGLFFGPPPGIIAALPVEVLRPENRAPGMGLFHTCYYIGMPLLTAVAGLSRDLTGNPAAPLLFGGVMILLVLPVLALFRTLQRRWANP